MIDPLAPQPMTAKQVARLIERVRAAQPTRSSEVAKAVDWAREHGTTAADAARLFGIQPQTVARAAKLKRMKCGEPKRRPGRLRKPAAQ